MAGPKVPYPHSEAPLKHSSEVSEPGPPVPQSSPKGRSRGELPFKNSAERSCSGELRSEVPHLLSSQDFGSTIVHQALLF
jgi:hypothetical protein